MIEYKILKLGPLPWDSSKNIARLQIPAKIGAETIDPVMETTSNPAIAQAAIAEMIISNFADITPCGGCRFATEKGCAKESFISAAGEKEVGPVYDLEEGIAVCPIQRGKLLIPNYNGHTKK